MRRSVLILKCGSAQREVAAKVGDYETWFIRSLGGDPARFTVVDPQKSEPFPDPARCAAVLATGSPSSVLEHRPWMAETGAYLWKASDLGVPVLAVCFAHQLLADTLGAPVQRNPHGREFGAVDVELTAEGQRHPLFRGISAKTTFQANHEDEVVVLPQEVSLLAGNAHSPIQAFQYGALLMGVQFHPELWLEPVKAIAAERRIAPQHYRAEETPAGHTLLKNFHDHYIVPREN
jgi:GMP synthase (glutamine-hydrolysing)